ncbi:MAG TPA: inositol monophosphatase family protein [Pseudomonadales bacterium]|nr:inositol monophosphatase family protein [Pseudomonadales bacterium]
MTDTHGPAGTASLPAATLQTYRDFAIETLRVAGRHTLEHFRAATPVDDKSTRAGAFDPVTAADRGAERVIREAIRARWPEHAIVGEEGPDEGPGDGSAAGADARDADARNENRMGWTIDPVDGTRAFICGFVHWGMLLALTRDGRPLLGVVHQPWTGETWVGSALGAEFRRDGEQRTFATRACADLADAVLASTDPYLFEGAEAECFDALRRAVRLTRFGTDCYAYCMLAMGQIDLVVESGLSPWDVQALMPVIEAAGGVITDWRGGDCSGGGQVLAAGDRALHAQVLARLAAAATTTGGVRT